MLDPAWLTALAALVTVAGGLTVWLVRHLWKILRRVTRFLDDFFGEPPREGLPGKPGVMARLASVEQLTTKIAGEMEANHGTSLRDVVQRTATDVTHLKTEQRIIKDDMQKLRQSDDRRSRT